MFLHAVGKVNSNLFWNFFFYFPKTLLKEKFFFFVSRDFGEDFFSFFFCGIFLRIFGENFLQDFGENFLLSPGKVCLKKMSLQ